MASPLNHRTEKSTSSTDQASGAFSTRKDMPKDFTERATNGSISSSRQPSAHGRRWVQAQASQDAASGAVFRKSRLSLPKTRTADLNEPAEVDEANSDEVAPRRRFLPGQMPRRVSEKRSTTVLNETDQAAASSAHASMQTLSPTLASTAFSSRPLEDLISLASHRLAQTNPTRYYEMGCENDLNRFTSSDMVYNQLLASIKIEEIEAIYQANNDRFQTVHLNLALYLLAKLSSESKNQQTPNTRIISALWMRLKDRLKDCQARELTHILFACDVLHIYDVRFIDLVLEHILIKIKEFEPIELGHVATTLASLRIGAPLLLEAIVAQTFVHKQNVTPQDLGNLALAFSTLKIRNERLFGLIVEQIREKKEAFLAQDLVYICSFFAIFEVHSHELMQSVVEALITSFHQLELQDLVSIASSLAFIGLKMEDNRLLNLINQKVLLNLSRFSPEQLISVLRSLMQLGFRDKQLLEAVADKYLTKKTVFNDQQITLIATAFAQLGIANHAFIRSLPRIVEENIRTFKVQDLTQIVHVFAVLNIQNPRLIEAMVGIAIENKDHLTLENLSTLASSLAKLRMDHPPLRALLTLKISPHLQECSSEALVNTICGLAEFDLTDPSFMRLLIQEAIRRARAQKLNSFDLLSLTMAVSSLKSKNDSFIAAIDHEVRHLITAITEEMRTQIIHLTPKNLCALAFAIAVLKGDSEELLNLIAGQAIRQINDLEAEDLVTLTWAFSVCHFLHEGMMNAIAERACRIKNNLENRDLAALVYNFAIVGYRHETFMKQMAEKSIEVFVYFTIEDLTQIIMAHGMLGMHHEGLLKTILTQIPRRISTFGANALCQLLWALALNNKRDMRFIEKVANEIFKKIRDCSPEKLVSLLDALYKLNNRDYRLLEAVSEELRNKISEFRPELLVRAVDYFYRLDFLDPHSMEFIAKQLIPNIKTLTNQDFVTAATSFAMLGTRNRRFMQAIANESMERVATFDLDSLVLLAYTFAVTDDFQLELFLAIQRQLAQYPLASFSKTSFYRQQQVQTWLEFRQTGISLLPSGCFLFYKHTPSNLEYAVGSYIENYARKKGFKLERNCQIVQIGFEVAFMITSPAGSFVIDILDSSEFLYPHGMNGVSLFLREQITRSGFRLIPVSYVDWQKCESEAAKMHFIERTLSLILG